MRTQEISDSLYISVHTVRRHRYNIMQKLKLKSATDLIKYAFSEGYIEKL
jgi:DNA-binding CsgD family transcriptional regulator